MALGQHAALLHDGDGVGDVHHDVHVVLDEHHGVLVLQALDQPLHVVQVVDAHARGGLVQEDRLRARSQRHAHLQPALLAVREVAHGRVGMALQAQPRQHAGHHIGAGSGTHGRAPAVECLRGRRALRGQPQVLAHRQREEQARHLERARHAALHAAMVRLARHVVAVEHDAPAAHRLGAGEHVEQRGLARAVGADHRMHGVRAHLQIDTRECCELVVALLDADGFQQDGGRAHALSPVPAGAPSVGPFAPRRRSQVDSSRPQRPRCIPRLITISTTPSSSSQRGHRVESQSPTIR